MVSIPIGGKSLGSGTRQDARVVCPSHRERFDLRTGKSADEFGHEVQTGEIITDGDDVYLEVWQVPEKATPFKPEPAPGRTSAKRGVLSTPRKGRTGGTRRSGKQAFIPDGRERPGRMSLDSPCFAERPAETDDSSAKRSDDGHQSVCPAGPSPSWTGGLQASNDSPSPA